MSEAHHYTLFLKFSRQYGKSEKAVNEKWEALLDFESQLMAQLGKKRNYTRLTFFIEVLIHILNHSVRQTKFRYINFLTSTPL